MTCFDSLARVKNALFNPSITDEQALAELKQVRAERATIDAALDEEYAA